MNNELERYEQTESEIDLIQMMYAVFRQWKKMIAWGIIVAVFFVGIKIVTSMLGAQDKEEVDQKLLEYNNLVQFNSQAKQSSREKMVMLNKDILEKQSYINRSIFMRINPYEIDAVEKQFFVKTNYQILPSMTYQNKDRTGSIVNAYMTLLQNESFLQEYCTEHSLELRYLQELISVENNEEAILTVRVIADSADKAQSIMDYLITAIDEYKPFISSTVDKFEITEISSSTYSYADESMAAQQLQTKEELSELMQQYLEEQQHFQQLEKTVIEEPEVSTNRIVKNIIKFGVVGGVLGVFLVCGVAAVLYIIGGSLYSARTMQEKYHVPVVGNIAVALDKKYSRLDMWIRKKEGRAIAMADDELQIYELASAHIRNAVAPGAKLMIAGQTSRQNITHAVELFSTQLKGIQVIDGGNLLTSPKSIELLPACDGLLLVEECKVSQYSDIEKEIELAECYGKKLVGCFVMED